jgi:predicted phosphoribosyltransferase
VIFTDRVEAGERLAERLRPLVNHEAIVLGIPRGGVIVAREVARALGLPLDVVVPRKLGAPANPELGIGAVAPEARVVDDFLVRRLGVTPEYLERETARQLEEIERRLDGWRDVVGEWGSLRWLLERLGRGVPAHILAAAGMTPAAPVQEPRFTRPVESDVA